MKRKEKLFEHKIELILWNGESIHYELETKKEASKQLAKCKKHPQFKIVRLTYRGKLIKEFDCFTRQWIKETGIPIIESYTDELTLRALHYRLVARGMTNTNRHYKRVVAAMIEARWEGLVNFDAFKDHERESIGMTASDETTVDSKSERAKTQVEAWMTSYSKNRWENQPYYPEVFIEKKALQGVFDRVCTRHAVALNPCKGYPSLTFLYDAKERFDDAINDGKNPVILYFGDYDPSGEDIPRSIEETLARMGTLVEVRRIALMEHQVIEWELPPAPAKDTDTRSATWDGLGQVELDAVMPEKLKELCTNAIESIFDASLHAELIEQEKEEREEFQTILKDFVSEL